jgi:predicted dinucleotide-binding enzyme
MTTVGILGAGKLGAVLARLATAAGHNTLVAGSSTPDRIELILSVLAPAAHAVTAETAARDADIVILAAPLGRYDSLPAEQLTGKVVVDAMNYWPPSDGVIAEFEGTPSSLVVAAALPGARLVKALSHLGYHELGDDSRPTDAPDRHAIALAGDDTDAVTTVAQLIDQLGFDPVIAGPLVEGVKFGPGSALFGVSEKREVVEKLLTAPQNASAAFHSSKWAE